MFIISYNCVVRAHLFKHNSERMPFLRFSKRLLQTLLKEEDFYEPWLKWLCLLCKPGVTGYQLIIMGEAVK